MKKKIERKKKQINEKYNVIIYIIFYLIFCLIEWLFLFLEKDSPRSKAIGKELQ